MAPVALILALRLSIVPTFIPSVGIGEHGQQIISRAANWSALVEYGHEQVPGGVIVKWTWRVK